jgi:nucleoredoxin
LCEWYKKHGARGDLEMVFVSSDRDLASFKAYSAHFPFPAIAYEDRAVKQKLSQEYGITGIPSLIVVDPKGELVTKNGREGVTARPEAFPWTPKTLGQELEGPLLRADGSRIANATEHLRGKKVALYFSASWCGPCKKFSPVLIECYKSLQAAGKPFEVIFVSADHDQESFDAYFKHMPWTALPYGDPRIEALNGLLEVEGIPTTILVDGDSYRILNKELRGVVMQDPKGEQFPWRPQPVSILSEAFLGHINDVACVLLFLPEGRKAAEFDPILRGTAARILDEAEASGKDAKLRFAIAEHDNQLGASIRSFLNQSPQKEPELVLLDIPSARKFLLRGAPITPELVAETAKDFLANSLKNSRGIKVGALCFFCFFYCFFF